MSEVKVNKISPRTNCGTVTLGDSGDTIALGSGASQTGFGRTGTVDWITTPKVTGDSPITGVTGKGYFLNTTAGTITINLPAGAAGSIVSMADYANTWQTNNVTIAANGAEKIGGSANDATLSTEGQSVTFVYADGTQGWINVQDSTSNIKGLTYMTASVSGACNTLTTAPDCANVKLAKFVGPGTFTVCTASNVPTYNEVSYMVVAGGGGGGGTHGGGGGAGGFREYKSPLTPYTASPLDGNPGGTSVTLSQTAYPITVGAGGAAATYPVTPDYTGQPGNDSIFSSITSTAGGGGGGGGGIGKNGGSGSGGGNSPPFAGGNGNLPSTSPAQGTGGGTGSTAGGTGGGGGSTVAGVASGPTNTGGDGGAGATTSISATPTAYGGGGGGGASAGSLGTGGVGGGGNGTITPGSPGATAGTVNTGGGGGGGGSSGGGALGGSGIIYIRYKFQ